MKTRTFCIGSEWLYYKIYTGVQTADSVLIEKLHPVIEKLKRKGIIEKWFFIRYKDTDEHLRIRFYNQDPVKLLEVIPKLHTVLNKLLQEDVVWKIQVDTYQKEMERYGNNTMADSETLFYHDSEMIVSYLKIKKSFDNNKIQLLFSLTAIDSFLNGFSLSLKEKLDLLNSLQLDFKQEFEASKVLKKEFDKNYRELSLNVHSFLENNSTSLHKLIKNKEKNTKLKSKQMKNKLNIPLHSFLSSHIHMIINRQYTSKQRYYECLIYDHLYRYYKEKHFRTTQNH